jgi:hypothetical protein
MERPCEGPGGWPLAAESGSVHIPVARTVGSAVIFGGRAVPHRLSTPAGPESAKLAPAAVSDADRSQQARSSSPVSGLRRLSRAQYPSRMATALR